MDINGLREKIKKNEDISLDILEDDSILDDLDRFEIIDIILRMNDFGKEQILYNQEFLKKHKKMHHIKKMDLMKIINSLSNDAIERIIIDKELIIHKLKLKEKDIVNIVIGLQNDDAKIKVIDTYEDELNDIQNASIIKSFHDQSKKVDFILQRYLDIYRVLEILESLDYKTLCDFFMKNRDFCEDLDIHPYEITSKLDIEGQKNFFENIENIGLTLIEKIEIIATFRKNVKSYIDTDDLPEEYKVALSIPLDGNNRVILDLERNLEDYRYLDNLISVNPIDFTPGEKKKFLRLCEICPNLEVINTIGEVLDCSSTGAEYKEGEEWISSVIDNLDPKYSKAQKMAIIDNAIGKKISYCFDHKTEIARVRDSRALWRIICRGYGVCNGIANLENYMFRLVGIESKIVGGRSHAFLKVEDMEFTLANGEVVKGTTIIDPTWNLAMHRFGAKPNLFCISYEEARRLDIDKQENKDLFCHKNDEELQDATFGLDEKSLRELFKSVGLTDKEGNFPIKEMIEKSKRIHEVYANQPAENIKNQFLLLSQVCPEFATCEKSSMYMLSLILLKSENLKFSKCIINRVYNISDDTKSPVLYVYVNSNELGRRFYIIDKGIGQFIEYSPEEFTKQFECYDYDLRRQKRN